jgi:hypothetical protein
MFKLLRALVPRTGGKTGARTAFARVVGATPDEVIIDGVAPFPIAKHLSYHGGLPIMDWRAVESWMSGIHSPERQRKAWVACERAWLLHFRSALGHHYRLAESDGAILLSSLEKDLAEATLGYVDRTRQRIVHVLDGIAQIRPVGKDLMIAFDDQAAYYHYVSYYYPERGKFALSGGMLISTGCSHFVTVKTDLRSIEPVIAHEMTHGCVANLPLPLWLNEGLAVNTEQRLTGSGASLYMLQELREKHRAFWGEKEIQQFWSGSSFDRTDDGNRLSYDLARIMVEQMAKHWEQFKRFVLAADRTDAGALAARRHLGVDLGDYVCALLEKTPSPGWTPDSRIWKNELD